MCALKCDVLGISRSNYTIEKAKKYCENVFKSFLRLKHCDIIFVCTHINKTEQILDKLDKILPESTIVVDVCSLKRFLCNKKRHYKFIPSHPMAGTEFVGFDYSFEALFQKTKWILTPLENTEEDDIKKVINIIEVLGATPIFATPKEHDEAVAMISHMPMLIAQAIFKTAQHNSLSLKLASSGFRDMTRLALSSGEMAEDLINLNSDNIQEALLKLYSSVGELLSDNYLSQITDIKKERQIMYIDGKNIL